MIHLGDITKLNGAELPVVDVITGGSPCQDLSVAGKRAGLAGERSGLFMEQVRIVKEMREHDRSTGRTGCLTRPRYMLWENVPGAFSSGNPKGADFAAVIEEIIKVAEPGTSVSVCVPNGGWTKSGCYYAEDGSWSVAWRVHDAQFWGVPQRRKRISLVADFGGLSAPEILFERKGLSGDSEQSGEAREETAGAAGGRVEGASCYGETGIGYWQPGIQTLRAEGENRPSRPSNVIVSVHSTQDPIVGNDISPCISQWSANGTATVAATISCLNDQGGSQMGVTEDVTGTLRAEEHGHQPVVFDPGAASRLGGYCYENMSGTLRADMGDNQPAVCYVISPAVAYRKTSHAKSAEDGQGWAETDASYYKGCGERQGIERDVVVQTYQKTTGTLSPGAHAGSYNGQDAYNDMLIASVYGVSSFGHYKEGTTSLRAQGGDNGGGSENIAVQNSIVRRLTPLECERLQGFPDKWTDIGEWTDSKGKMRKCSDSARYKALGNSIAIPFWFYILRRMAAQYERPATLGSLFDGIGGFPLCWERCNGKGSAIWASEIEEFPIAVTKKHFKEEQ